MNFRNCCFTLNNYTASEVESIKNWEAKYIIFGYEKGESGTPHIQGYVEWKNARKLSTLKNLNDRIHWEARKGSAFQASEYCKKEGNIWEKGIMSNQGKRSDLDSVVESINDGNSLAIIASTNPQQFIKYHKGIEKLLSLTRFSDRTTKPYIEWRYGKSGTGKTRYCIEKHPNHYIKDGTMWWDGYTQNEAIIIDDFDGNWPYRDLLRLLDYYKYQGQFKGGYIPINSPFIYITCEFPPEYFWSDNKLTQILRRCDVISEVMASEVVGNTNATTYDIKKSEERAEKYRR